MSKCLLQLLQRRVASIAVGPSTARRMGPPGTIDAARSFLAVIDLSALSRVSPPDYPATLDRLTDDFVRALPDGARFWGAARKFLNIFLRDVFYTRQLCEAFPLHHLEDSLEVPLDSHVALALRSEPEGAVLPRWQTIIGLQAAVSAHFQDVALAVARRRRLARVHLDLLYWRSEERTDKSPAANRRPAGPLAGSDNLSATLQPTGRSGGGHGAWVVRRHHTNH